MLIDQANLIRHRLARAAETIEEADVLLKSGYSIGVVNRLYYACFYAVSALLHSEGQSSSKHSGVVALFNQHWVKSRRVPVELGEFYRQMFSRRQKGDYQDIVEFSTDDLSGWLVETRRFVDYISQWLKDKAGI